MSISTVTHLNFTGQARDALAFYQQVFGGELTLATYADFGLPADQPDADKIVFGRIVAPNGFTLMAYDIPTHPDTTPRTPSTTRREHGTTITDSPFFVSLRATTPTELTPFWTALTHNATIIEPLAPAPWTPAFGMLTDRFGTTWILDTDPAH